MKKLALKKSNIKNLSNNAQMQMDATPDAIRPVIVMGRFWLGILLNSIQSENGIVKGLYNEKSASSALETKK
ncbi:hypothetical protein CWB99_01660 [Pseudoalteromonas rubra]|uniref:Uncharacterized protein n=1 Tax=Pseudoalteromonas rubra TaxID=43658 RepID=A0A5S3WT48_9GAMM|nr:hypothetical protein [Pseudoalteromonas rubra]TMP32605.1 hypothetical protein CWB99_01660 [Pseudoalteromonas rubra]TMP34332.1 hypothetical protein CWC00_08140 [Pseudoalteromonas rubra]